MVTHHWSAHEYYNSSRDANESPAFASELSLAIRASAATSSKVSECEGGGCRMQRTVAISGCTMHARQHFSACTLCSTLCLPPAAYVVVLATTSVEHHAYRAQEGLTQDMQMVTVAGLRCSCMQWRMSAADQVWQASKQAEHHAPSAWGSSSAVQAARTCVPKSGCLHNAGAATTTRYWHVLVSSRLFTSSCSACASQT